jgi:hypothetical protein
MNNISDIDAMRKWNGIPEDTCLKPANLSI